MQVIGDSQAPSQESAPGGVIPQFAEAAPEAPNFRYFARLMRGAKKARFCCAFSALRASAAFISVVVCFKVLAFDPKITVPPITAAIAPIMRVALNPIAPMIIAKIRIPPAPAANFENENDFSTPFYNVRKLLNVIFIAQYLFVQVTVVIIVKSTLHLQA